MAWQNWRRNRISRALFRRASTVLPPMSDTEREAIEAGSVWFDGELFSGCPNWESLLAMPPARLTEAEQAFMDGPVRQLCAMVADWPVTLSHDLPPEVWQFMRQQRFFGMVIPQQYGGLGFSHTLHSEAVRTISSASIVAGVTVMVPNSLGPGELLLHFGTEAQKDAWLPRLADGSEIPCFGLTSEVAGSDAAAMTDTGVVCWGQFDGHSTLGIRLNFRKRYITLGPVATVMGLAFKLQDPDNLLGGGAERGITVVLLPTSTPGVQHGQRHIPQFTWFQNGPLEGQDVFVPLEWVLGGEARIGQGWQMLMTALAAGRSISLPSQSSGATAMCARVTGAYARVRRQFNVAIAQFEGVREHLADLAANAYLVDAARRTTLAALDQGHRPSVISAIMKYHATELMRQSILKAMDIHGGKAIVDGPRNYLAAQYRSVPIAITVEGANILTRNLMIFGQGAMRSHPYLLAELQALANPDKTAGLHEFDTLLWQHLRHSWRNAGRSLAWGWSAARLAPAPPAAAAVMVPHWRQLSRYAAAFAVLADLALLTLGGALKRKERLSARLGDILAELYLLATALKRFEDEGRPPEDEPLVHYVMQQGYQRLAEAFQGVLQNLPARWAAWLLRCLAFPFGVRRHPPSDRLAHQVAETLLQPNAQRDRLTTGLYLGEGHDEHPLRDLEVAMRRVALADPISRKMRAAGLRDAALARQQGVITDAELAQWLAMQAAVAQVVAVDAFAPDELPGATASQCAGVSA